MKKILEVVLVDDEEYCRRDLAELLEKMSQVKIVGEADNAKEAIRMINQLVPDVVFLDINLAGVDGFQVIPKIENQPAIVAVTAHAQHAAEGFSKNLVDYILKPVEEMRLLTALHRSRDHILLHSLKKNPVVQVEIQGLITPLTISDIFWVKASENYVEICSTAGRGLVRSTFAQFKRLLPAGFTLEISRGLIVARHQIQHWKRDPSGRIEISLKCGGVLKSSRRMQKDVVQQLELLF